MQFEFKSIAEWSAQIWHNLSLTLTPSQGNISALQPSMVTNEVSFESRKNNKCNDIQCNTKYFQTTPEIYGLKNIPNFLWGFYIQQQIKNNTDF